MVSRALGFRLAENEQLLDMPMRVSPTVCSRDAFYEHPQKPRYDAPRPWVQARYPLCIIRVDSIDCQWTILPSNIGVYRKADIISAKTTHRISHLVNAATEEKAKAPRWRGKDEMDALAHSISE